MGNPDQGLKGRGPLGTGVTNPGDGGDAVVVDKVRFSEIRPPETTHYKRIWFGTANNSMPALFEFKPQSHWLWGVQIHDPFLRSHELSFKPGTRRDWYEVGDLVLYTSMPEWKLKENFPELAEEDEEDSLIGTLVLGFLLGPPEDYKIAYKITRILPFGDGTGKIELVPILVLDDKTFVELEKRMVRTAHEFNGWWIANSVAAPLIAFLNAAATVFYEVAMGAATGGFSSAARGGARGAALFTLKQARRYVATRVVARKIVVNLAKGSVKATIAATTEFLRVFAKTYKSESTKQTLAQRAGGEIDRHAYDVAIRKAAGASAAKFITSLLNISLDKMLKNAGYGKIQEEFSKRIIQAFGTNIPAIFTKSLANAWANESQRKGAFEETLAKELYNEVLASMKSIVGIDFKSVGEALSKQ